MPSTSTDVLSVGSVWRRSRNALAREFRHSVWVTGEIKSLREWRGNWYLTLIEPGGNADGSDITLDVACPPKRRLVVQSQLQQVGISLQAGMQVNVCGPVTVGRLGKLQLELLQLDTQALVGAHALERRRVVEALQGEGLWLRNKQLSLSEVPLCVGVVGSDGSDGVRDFVDRLSRSPYAYQLKMRHAPVQGPAAESALANAIRSLYGEHVDVVVVVRGGGGELDAFDKERVVRAVAESPHPVWTGIGHTADESLVDRIAHRACVTPTACADALVEWVERYQRRIDEAFGRIGRLAEATSRGANEHLRRQTSRLIRCGANWAPTLQRELDGVVRHIGRVGEHTVSRSRWHLEGGSAEVRAAASRVLQSSLVDVRNQRRQLELLDPKRQMQRGYAIVRDDNGEVVRDTSNLREDQTVEIALGRGKLGATITRVVDEEEQ